MEYAISPIWIGIDLGGTSLRVGLYGPEMQLLDRRSIRAKVELGPDEVVADMANAIHILLEQHGCSSEVAGIGIGSPGPLNLRTGSLALLPNFPGCNGYPLRARLAAKTGFPVTLDCDANAAALAEWKLGAGRERGVDGLILID